MQIIIGIQKDAPDNTIKASAAAGQERRMVSKYLHSRKNELTSFCSKNSSVSKNKGYLYPPHPLIQIKNEKRGVLTLVFL